MQGDGGGGVHAEPQRGWLTAKPLEGPGLSSSLSHPHRCQGWPSRQCPGAVAQKTHRAPNGLGCADHWPTKAGPLPVPRGCVQQEMPSEALTRTLGD